MSVRKADKPLQLQLGNDLSDACTYDVEASPIRKDSSKLVKVNKRPEIKDERRKDQEEFRDTSVAAGVFPSIYSYHCFQFQTEFSCKG